MKQYREISLREDIMCQTCHGKERPRNATTASTWEDIKVLVNTNSKRQLKNAVEVTHQEPKCLASPSATLLNSHFPSS
jgi:hypothetical protein